MAELHFDRAAEAEIQEIVDFYDSEYPGRAGRFLDDVRAALKLAQEMPHSGALHRNPRIPPEIEVRSFLLRRFPYRVVTAIAAGERVVVAISDCRKADPEYWANRLK